jgi:bifunctional phosphoglucose/phosphomannose isomerase
MSTMRDTLQRFQEQFAWEPVVEHNDVLRAYANYCVIGMGGSHLGPWLLKRYAKLANLTIHRDYGIPSLPTDTLVILSSYSGTTEEVLDAAREALLRGLPLAAISTGGKLLEFAVEHAIPYVRIPETGLEPRMAIGFSMLGIARLISNTGLEQAVRQAGLSVDPMAGEIEGTRIGMILRGKIPLIYSSAQNTALAYRWKIELNETAKIPAFCNTFPELCHTMSSQDLTLSSQLARCQKKCTAFFWKISQTTRGSVSACVSLEMYFLNMASPLREFS